MGGDILKMSSVNNQSDPKAMIDSFMLSYLVPITSNVENISTFITV